MGLFDFIEDLDTSEGHLWEHGFNRAVCRGETDNYDTPCPKRTEGTVPTCGCCGCPLFNLDKTKAPPESCPRLDGHEGE